MAAMGPLAMKMPAQFSASPRCSVGDPWHVSRSFVFILFQVNRLQAD
jgi:hypothetical protein